MYEGIEYRGFGQDIVEELAKHAGVPVWNGLTNEYHPTQMLADMLTVREHFGKLKGLKLVYMGDARYNMGNSLMVVCSKLGLDFVACTNKKYFPNDELVACLLYTSADKIIYPEQSMGLRVARNLMSGGYLDVFELSAEFSMAEFSMPVSWSGKNLVDLNVRERFHINIIGIKPVSYTHLESGASIHAGYRCGFLLRTETGGY